MKTMLEKLGVIQNVGLGDRLLRIVIGMVMLVGTIIYLQGSDAYMGWQAYIALLSVYPLMTGILGWCPLYTLSRVKTCKMTGRNQCGTLPYQVDAALGHRPVAERDYDHSLAGSHH